MSKSHYQSYHNSQSERRKMSQEANENSEWKQVNCLKRGKTRVTKSWLFLFLHLIGWEGVTSFLDQSQGEVKQNHALQFDIDSWKLLYRLLQIRTLEVTVLLQCFSARLFSVNFFHSCIQPRFTRLLWWIICPSVSSLCLRATLSASCQS